MVGAIAEEPDRGAVHQPIQRHGDTRSGKAILSRLATLPVVCRNDSGNGTLFVREKRIAAERPGLPSIGASTVISLSSQTRSNPQLRTEAVWQDLSGQARMSLQARIVKPRAMWRRTNQIIATPGTSETTVIAITRPMSV